MTETCKRITLLDGGTGTSLANMGHEFVLKDLLWSAGIVKSNPQDLVKLHKNFFHAGADIVVTATYQAWVEGFQKRFTLSETEAKDLFREIVELAKTARDEAEKETSQHGWVAGSVGPYGATLCDFSEFHGRYADNMTIEELSAWHLPRLQLIVEAKPDILAIETIPVLKEAEAILNCLQQFPEMKAWVTFQCKDGSHTGHGEDIKEAVKTVLQYKQVVAVGFNCTHPDYMTELIKNVASMSPNVPIIAKPNGGVFDHDGRSTTRQNIATKVQEWVDSGASWIGGCCYIYPNDITEMRETLKKLPDMKFIEKGDNLL